MPTRFLAAAALLAAPFPAPAHAATAVTMTCVLDYGWGDGSASCAGTGAYGGTVGNFVAVLALDAELTCPVSHGRIGDWSYTRYGNTATISPDGLELGGGTLTFSAPCPTPGERAVLTVATVDRNV